MGVLGDSQSDEEEQDEDFRKPSGSTYTVQSRAKELYLQEIGIAGQPGAGRLWRDFCRKSPEDRKQYVQRASVTDRVDHKKEAAAQPTSSSESWQRFEPVFCLEFSRTTRAFHDALDCCP